MEFRLLGEVQLRAGGLSLDVGAARQQAVLAVDAGRPVGIETLIDRVWDDLRDRALSHLDRQYVARAAARRHEHVVLARVHHGHLERERGGRRVGCPRCVQVPFMELRFE